MLVESKGDCCFLLMNRIFILSPAQCNGLRARMILRPQADFDLARRLQAEGIPLAELFTFLSGLYFRGKLTYASVFADPPEGCSGILVITPCCGLMEPGTRITAEDLRLFAGTNVGEHVDAYIGPLAGDARRLAECAGPDTDIVLLGSIATRKYVKVLLECFGPRLRFPRDFVGRGDMSRGGLLLRRASDREELEYVPVEGAVLHGKKPPKLEPLRRRPPVNTGDEERR
jgi:hypothetical protein